MTHRRIGKKKKTRKIFNVVSIDDQYVNCIYLCNPLMRAICITTLILPRVFILLFWGVGGEGRGGRVWPGLDSGSSSSSSWTKSETSQ